MASVILYLMILLFCSTNSRGKKDYEFATSVTEMEILLEAENLLIQNMLKYAKELDKKITIIKNVLIKMDNKNIEATKNAEKFLSNPLNSFSLIRRLHDDWNDWIKYFEKPIGNDFIKVMEIVQKIMPTDNDLKEATEGLHRIQTIYDLQTEDMIKGLLNGKQYKSKLNVLDIYSFGMELFKLDNPQMSLNWLEAGLRTEFDRQLYKRVFDIDIDYFYNNYKSIAKQSNLSFKNLSAIKSAMKTKKNEIDSNYWTSNLIKTMNLNIGGFHYGNVTEVLKAYKSACGISQSKILNSHLSCIYNDYSSPYLIIAPIKVEFLSLQPLVAFFYEVASEKDINALKEIGRSGLERSKVGQSGLGNKKKAVRTSKTFMIQKPMANFSMELWTKRMQGIFDIKYKGGEASQISNYGIGGHYALHYDFWTGNSVDGFVDGNRFVTVVYYLSDVEQGGATIFPILNLSVFPVKGAALLWYNLNNGVPDYTTLHSACPVIVGSKWIMTTWVHEYEVY